MNALIVAFPRFSEYLSVAFSDGGTPFEWMARRVEEFRGTGETPVLLLAGGEVPREVRGFVPTHWTVVDASQCSGSEVLTRVADATDAAVEHLVWIDGNAPLWSVGLTRQIYELHATSWCDYTFADGFPEGFAPEVVRRDIMKPLAALAEGGTVPWTRTLLFDALTRDINAFDVETEAARQDYSLMRLSLTVDRRGDYLLCRRVAENAGSTPAEEQFSEENDAVLVSVREDREGHRTVPRYVTLQVTERMTSRATFQPWVRRPWEPPQDPRDMSPAAAAHLLEEVAALSPDATVVVGYRGEPGAYPNFPELVEILGSYPRFSCYLETSGVGWTRDNREALRKASCFQAVIVEVDAAREETYRSLRGDHWTEVQSFIAEIRSGFAGKVYIQATRIPANEWELQDFFTHWSHEDGVEPIIQKYNSYAGRLEDLRVADLTPLERTPCFHLQRDMVIRVDGTVPRCFQDLDNEGVRGAITPPGTSRDLTSLEEAWQNGARDYRSHLAGVYPGICTACDEYYTFYG